MSLARFARPGATFFVSVPVQPAGVVVKVGRGTSFTVRVDAQDVDEDTGAVTYPLAYVLAGSSPKDAPREKGVPVSRVSPESFTASEDEVTLSADVACDGWVYTFATCSCAPGGCGCSR